MSSSTVSSVGPAEGQSVSVQGNIEKVEGEIEKVKGEIEKVGDKIEKVEGEIVAVEDEIKAVKGKLATSETARASDLQARLSELGTEKMQLRTKEDRLRKEKQQLRTKEDRLREEKKQLQQQPPPLAPRAAQVTDSPSDFAKSVTMAKYQDGPNPTFWCLRPYVGPPGLEPMPLPVDLMAAAFGRFADAVGTSARSPQLQPTPQAMQLAADVCIAMSGFFPNEDRRRTTFVNLLQPFFSPFRLITEYPVSGQMPNSCYRADIAALALTSPEVARLLAKFAVKLEWGPSYFQAQRFFQAFLEVHCRDLLAAGDVCPVVLMLLGGPSLQVCMAASEEDLDNLSKQPRITCEPLASVDLLYNPRRPQLLIQVARVLMATKIALEDLNEHYITCGPSAPSAAGTTSTAGPGSAALRRVPYPLRAKPYSGAERLIASRQVFTAQHATWGSVIVKFCCPDATYGADVHRLWAEAGLAPKLLALETLPGSIPMVVMAPLAEADGWAPLCNVLEGLLDRAAAQRAVRAALACAQALRWPNRPEAKTVHGDMRPGNTLIRVRPDPSDTKASSSGPQLQYEVQFVDFDRAGIEGEVCYPLTMSPDVAWAEGMAGGGAITQAHDASMAERLFLGLPVG